MRVTTGQREKMKKAAASELESRLKDQMVAIERVRDETGLSIEQMAEMVAIKPQTLTKYAAGYQPASRQLLQLIQGIPARVGARGGLPHDVFHASAELRRVEIDGSTANVEPTLLKKIGLVLEHCTFGEISGLRALIDEFYRLALKREKEEPLEQPAILPPLPTPAKIIRMPLGYELRPVFGDIAAGRPQEAIAQAEQFIQVPPELAQKCTFVLRVRGVSMVDRDINEGDLVAMDHRREPRDNSIVAALIDGETTLKTYVSRGGKIYLKSENSRDPVDIMPVEELTIQGVVVGNLGQA